MTDYCCVISCGKSRKEANSLFPFPKDTTLREEWIKAIKSVQPKWIPRARPYVCIDHFSKLDVITDTQRVHRKRTAIPYIFKGHTYTPEPVATIDPNSLAYAVQDAQINMLNNDLLSEDLVVHFSTLKSKYQTNLDYSGFSVAETDDSLIFYTLEDHENFGIVFKLRVIISSNMYIRVFIFEKELPKKEIKEGTMTDCLKITYFSQLQNILKRCLNLSEVPDPQFKDLIKNSITILEDARNTTDENEKTDILLCIIMNQLENLIRPRPKYISETLLFAFLCFNQSPQTYKRLREYLILPHDSYLRYLSGSLSNSKNDQNTTYLKTTIKTLEAHEKKVAIVIDEIHAKEGYNFKGLNVSEATQSNEAETTVRSFMVKSVFGSFKEIVRLYPSKECTGQDLYEKTSEILQYLQETLKLEVLAVITDNHPIHMDMFKLFAGVDDDGLSFSNPYLADRKIFLLFDTTHLYKDIRNNWLDNIIIQYPNFAGTSTSMRTANFEDLKAFHEQEKDQPVLKAKKLNHQTLYPDTTERQKVQLVDNVFHQSTINALQDNYMETGDFLSIINIWRNIVNVQTEKNYPMKKYKNPIQSMDSDSIDFLRKFTVWLEKWENHDDDDVLKETLHALLHTTRAIIAFCEYSFKTLKMKVVLVGLLQSDALQNRFRPHKRFVSEPKTEKRVFLDHSYCQEDEKNIGSKKSAKRQKCN
ncbi:hypothetical protein DMENIID0001_160820 [Sergentomyia squamirostris]